MFDFLTRQTASVVYFYHGNTLTLSICTALECGECVRETFDLTFDEVKQKALALSLDFSEPTQARQVRPPRT